MKIAAQFNLGKPVQARRNDPESPMLILILADWLGETRASVPPGQARPVKIDIDNFYQIMAKMAPSLSLDDHEKLDFSDIDDFHPDRLCQSFSRLKDLILLYQGLDDPARIRELMDKLDQPTDPSPTRPASADGATELEQLLGGRPPQQVRDNAGEDRVRKMIGEVVSPHLIDTRSAEPHRQAVVASLIEEMNAILQAPQFRSLEANWRGLWWLVSQLVSEDIQLALLPMNREELMLDLQAAGTDLEKTAIHRQIAGNPGQPSWSLVLGLHEFGPEVEDIMALTAIAMIAEAAAVPFIASASPHLVGCDEPRNLVDPMLWKAGPEDEALELWQSLRQSSAAHWISLVVPDVLARLPYGAGTDPIESFEFSESFADEKGLLMFSGALAVAAALGINFENHGGGMDPSTPVALQDLPGFSFSRDGEACFQSAVEIALPDRAMDGLIQRGFTPLAGAVNRTDVYVPACYALSGGALRGRWHR